MNRTSSITLAFGAALGLAYAPAFAAVTGVGSRALLGGTDSIDWGQLGPVFTIVNSPASVVSTGGLSATLSQPNNASFQRRDEGNGWNGAFAAGEHLIWDNQHGPTMTVLFANPVSAAGAAVQADDFGAYTGEIQAYDSHGNLLGSFLNSSSNNGGASNTAAFVGLISTSADISSVVFSTPRASGAPNDFAMDAVSLRTAGNVVTPEGNSALLLLGGVAPMGALAAGLRRRRRA